MLVLIGFAPVSAGLTGVLPSKHTHTHTLMQGNIRFQKLSHLSTLHAT